MNTITEYSPTEAALSELRDRLAGVLYDVTTTEGMKSARQDRKELVTLRTTLEAKRKEIKEPALERCRAIDAEAKRITAAILELEEPIDRQIKVEEERKAEEKRQREEAEAKRLQEIHGKIAAISSLTLKTFDMTADQVEEFLRKVTETLPITAEEFGEFVGQAIEAKSNTITTLQETLVVKRRAEAEAEAARIEQERLAAEREEQERLQLEAREAEEKRLAEERSELDRQREELRRQQEEAERKQREAQEEIDRLQREHQAAVDQQRRELEELQRKEQLRIEAELAEEQRRRLEELEAEEAMAAKEFIAKIKSSPYEALTAISEVASDPTLEDHAARMRVAQIALIGLSGRVDAGDQAA